jgi:Fe-S-cluster containining protein
VERRAAALLDRMLVLEPGWRPPYAVEAMGDARFDRLGEQLASTPCPLLDDTGRCRIYAGRPLVCRLIGLPMRAGSRSVIENACPIQNRFPGYAGMAPVPFDLETFEEEEAECLRAAAVRRFGEEARAGFETTIAAEVVVGRSPPR